MNWSCSSCSFQFSVTLDFSCREWLNLREEQVSNSSPVVLSKRIILSQINRIYDPLGLTISITLQVKKLIRLWWTEKEQQLEWDEGMPSHLNPEWFIFFQQLFEMQYIVFL